MSSRHGFNGRRCLAALVGIATGLVPATAIAAPDDEPPTITATDVAPSGLPSSGGVITITAEVVDDVGVAGVDATVYAPDGGASGVALAPTGPTTFTATFVVAPNGTDSAVNWNVEIRAVDTNGGEAMAFTGGVEVAGQPQFDEPPIVDDATVAPAALPPEGGTVTIGVTAWDLRGITDASATVTGPDGTPASVELQPVSADRFEGSFGAPANTGPTEARYGVTVAVHDDIGQETTADAGTFTVAGRPPVATGTLTVSPSVRVLGPVPPGGSTWRTVVVRNAGAAGGPPVEATATVSGRSFTLAGGRSLVLAPGQSVTLRITYSPTRRGLDLGRVAVRRVDGRQPALGAVLMGLAVGRS